LGEEKLADAAMAHADGRTLSAGQMPAGQLEVGTAHALHGGTAPYTTRTPAGIHPTVSPARHGSQ
jgi:hypothetical protein